MATWPASPFPQKPRPEGFTQTSRDNVIRSPVDYGPAKTRARTTAGIEDITCQIEIEETDLGTLRTFYNTNRSIPFTWIDWLTETSQDYKFTAPPTYTPLGGQWWLVTLSLETVPS